MPPENTKIIGIDNPFDINVITSETVEGKKKISSKMKLSEKNLETVSCSEHHSELKEDPFVRSCDWWNSDGKCDEMSKILCYKDSWDSD